MPPLGWTIDLSCPTGAVLLMAEPAFRDAATLTFRGPVSFELAVLRPSKSLGFPAEVPTFGFETAAFAEGLEEAEVVRETVVVLVM